MPPHALEVLVTVVAAAHLPVKGAPDTKVFVELTHGPVTQESARVPSRANADWAGQELLLPLQHLPLQSDTMHVKVCALERVGGGGSGQGHTQRAPRLNGRRRGGGGADRSQPCVCCRALLSERDISLFSLTKDGLKSSVARFGELMAFGA